MSQIRFRFVLWLWKVSPQVRTVELKIILVQVRTYRTYLNLFSFSFCGQGRPSKYSTNVRRKLKQGYGTYCRAIRYCARLSRNKYYDVAIDSSAHSHPR